MHWKYKRYGGLGMSALVIVCSGNLIMVWAWMLWDRVLWEHERYCGSGMDALVIGCTRNTNVIILLPHPRFNAKLRNVGKSPPVQKLGELIAPNP